MGGIIAGRESPPLVDAGQRKALWGCCVLVALVLTTNFYSARFLVPETLISGFEYLGADTLADFFSSLGTADRHLVDMALWGWSTSFFYLVPALFWLWLTGQNPARGMGWTFQGISHHWPVYIIMTLVMVPALVWAAQQPSFLRHYPFYKIPSQYPLWPRFFVWEMAYVFQFFALESFFRGFVVGQLGRVIGGSAVPVAMIPYCMIHFGKPLPETCASILAGLGLGTLSYRSGCILPGAVLHITVAITMDMASLVHQGRFS